MSEYRIGFTFTDNLWDKGARGEIIEQAPQGRWTVRWEGGEEEYTTETNTSITRMIKG